MPSEGLLRRIKRFEKAITRLRMFKERYQLDSILFDEDALDILENNTRVAVEALLDVGRFIIASQGWEEPSSYREIAHILEARGVLAQDEARLLSGLAGPRNIIVHMYAEIDYEELTSILGLLDSIEALMSRLLSFIEERGIDP